MPVTNDLTTNTSKRLPIVLCLDVSPTMNYHIKAINRALQTFIGKIKEEPKMLNAVELSFVAFSTHIEESTDFERADTFENKFFSVLDCGGSNSAMGILHSIKKLRIGWICFIKLV